MNFTSKPFSDLIAASMIIFKIILLQFLWMAGRLKSTVINKKVIEQKRVFSKILFDKSQRTMKKYEVLIYVCICIHQVTHMLMRGNLLF